MTRAALYFRQSLDVQEGIDRQRARCRAMADARGWKVVEEYVDNDVSASKPRGPATAWAQMLADSAAGGFEVVIAVDLDRLIRSNRDLITLTDAKARVVTVDGEIDLSTADGEFRGSMLASIARFEVRRKAERQKRANAHRISAGNPGAGKRPFGWNKDRVTLRKAEAAVLKHLHAEVIAGASLHSLVRDLNAQKVKTSQDKTWSSTQLRMVLLRPRNAGLLMAHGVQQEKSIIEPAVSLDDHNLVLSILTAPGRRIHRGPKPEINWLSGLMTCGVCGETLLTKNVTARGITERMYMCTSKLRRSEPDTRRHVSITARLVESKVLLSLYGHFSGGWIKLPKAEDASFRALQVELAENARRRTALTKLGVMPGADLGHIAGVLATLNVESETLEGKRLMALARSAGVPGLTELFEAGDSSDTAEKWLEIWEALPVERRRAVIRGAFEIVVEKGKGVNRVTVNASLAI